MHGCAGTWSQHPEVEAKLAAELDAAGLLVTPDRPFPRPMEYADLGRLTYLSWGLQGAPSQACALAPHPHLCPVADLAQFACTPQ